MKQFEYFFSLQIGQTLGNRDITDCGNVKCCTQHQVWGLGPAHHMDQIHLLYTMHRGHIHLLYIMPKGHTHQLYIMHKGHTHQLYICAKVRHTNCTLCTKVIHTCCTLCPKAIHICCRLCTKATRTCCTLCTKVIHTSCTYAQKSYTPAVHTWKSHTYSSTVHHVKWHHLPTVLLYFTSINIQLWHILHKDSYSQLSCLVHEDSVHLSHTVQEDDTPSIQNAQGILTAAYYTLRLPMAQESYKAAIDLQSLLILHASQGLHQVLCWKVTEKLGCLRFSLDPAALSG